MLTPRGMPTTPTDPSLQHHRLSNLSYQLHHPNDKGETRSKFETSAARVRLRRITFWVTHWNVLAVSHALKSSLSNSAYLQMNLGILRGEGLFNKDVSLS